MEQSCYSAKRRAATSWYFRAGYIHCKLLLYLTCNRFLKIYWGQLTVSPPRLRAWLKVLVYISCVVAMATAITCCAQLKHWLLLHIVHLQHWDFHKCFCKEVLRANAGFFPKWRVGISLKTNLKKRVNSIKGNTLFISLNLNIIVQKKTPDNCMFYGWSFMNKGYQIFKCWDSMVVCPPNNVSGYVPASHQRCLLWTFTRGCG